MKSLYIDDSTVGTRSFSASLTTFLWRPRATWSRAVSRASSRRATGSVRRGSPSRSADATQPVRACIFISSGPTGSIPKRSRSSASQM